MFTSVQETSLGSALYLGQLYRQRRELECRARQDESAAVSLNTLQEVIDRTVDGVQGRGYGR